MEWGEPIEVNGVRPTWLRDEKPNIQNKFREWYEPNRFTAADNRDYVWEYILAIKLPVDHPYYLATSNGFTYWPGGDAAPEDWDGERALTRSEYKVIPAYWSWGNSSRGRHDIIGYRKRKTAEEAIVDIIAREKDTVAEIVKGAPSHTIDGHPVHYIGAALTQFAWPSPKTPPPADLETWPPTLLRMEVEGLRARRDGLLEANNREVELKREAAEGLMHYKSRCIQLEYELSGVRADFERSEDELATYRQQETGRLEEMMRPAPTEAKPDHLTITITGPQGCGKTTMASVLGRAIGLWGAKVDGPAAAEDLHVFDVMRKIITGKTVTIVDGKQIPEAEWTEVREPYSRPVAEATA